MSELLGEARILVRADTAPFLLQLDALRAAATKPIVLPVVTAGTAAGASAAASTAASRSQAAAFRTTSFAASELAGAEAITARRTSLLTKEQIANAAASARQTAQLERGIASSTLSQFGLRGATLAASGGFIAGAAAAIVLTKSLKASVQAAEDLTIQTKRLQDTVGPLVATNVSAWASGLATNFGLAKDEAVGFVATLEGLFRNFGITAGEATTMSERLVQLAADMAAFKGQGTTTTEALTALQRGLAGNGRALRTFNVFVDQSRVAQEALAETGKTQISNLTRQELVLARYNLILRDTSSQVGAFRARSDTLAAQEAILSANLRNLAIVTGGPLVRALTDALLRVNDLFTGFEKAKTGAIDLAAEMKKIPGGGLFSRLTGPLKDLGLQFLATTDPAIGFLIHLKNLDDIFNRLFGSTTKAGAGLVTVTRDAGDASAAMARLAQETQAAQSALASVTGLEFKQLQIQTGLLPGGVQAELANLRQQEADQKKVVDATASGSKARREALQKLKSIQDQEKAITDQFAADAKQRAADAKSAAAKAKAARDAADQALLSLFSTQQTRITDALISAGPKQAIALTIRLRNLFRRQREEARKQIKDLQLRRDTLAADTTEIKTLNKQIRDLRKAQADAIAQAAQDAADARLTHLEALLSIAETTKRTSDDRAALERIIRFDIQRIDALKKIRHRTREENAQLDALRVDLAQREKALRDLKAQQDKNNNAAAELGFAFLQAQQGFAANLLGNLIPGGATGGLVGNASPTTGTPAGLRQVAGGFEEARGALSTRARIAGAPSGPSSGQASTTNELLRRILRTLEHLNTRTNHPEAARQRQTMNAAMDGVHGN